MEAVQKKLILLADMSAKRERVWVVRGAWNYMKKRLYLYTYMKKNNYILLICTLRTVGINLILIRFLTY